MTELDERLREHCRSTALPPESITRMHESATRTPSDIRRDAYDEGSTARACTAGDERQPTTAPSGILARSRRRLFAPNRVHRSGDDGSHPRSVGRTERACNRRHTNAGHPGSSCRSRTRTDAHTCTPDYPVYRRDAAPELVEVKPATE